MTDYNNNSLPPPDFSISSKGNGSFRPPLGPAKPSYFNRTVPPKFGSYSGSVNSLPTYNNNNKPPSQISSLPPPRSLAPPPAAQFGAPPPQQQYYPNDYYYDADPNEADYWGDYSTYGGAMIPAQQQQRWSNPMPQQYYDNTQALDQVPPPVVSAPPEKQWISSITSKWVKIIAVVIVLAIILYIVYTQYKKLKAPKPKRAQIEEDEEEGEEDESKYSKRGSAKLELETYGTDDGGGGLVLVNQQLMQEKSQLLQELQRVNAEKSNTNSQLALLMQTHRNVLADMKSHTQELKTPRSGQGGRGGAAPPMTSYGHRVSSKPQSVVQDDDDGLAFPEDTSSLSRK